MTISGNGSGYEGWKDIEIYGQSKLDWLRQFRPFESDIPHLHTIAGIVRAIESETLLHALTLWFNEQRQAQGKLVIVMDGKVFKKSYRNQPKKAKQIVTAYDSEQGLVLSQLTTESKKMKFLLYVI